MECRHVDGDKRNNSLSNLAWGTPAENAADKVRHGTDPKSVARKYGGNSGESNGRAKLKAHEVLEIVERLSGGEMPASLALEYGVSATAICCIRNGRKWSSVTGINPTLYRHKGLQ
jgi:hypothetical protein